MKRIFQFVSTNCLSGLENIVINISILLRHNYDFTYVSPNGSINYYLQKYNINHISVNKLTPLSVRSVIKKYHPDVVHGHDVKASIYLAMNSHFCHKHHIRIISELHNDDPRMWHLSVRSILYAMSSLFYDNIVMISKPCLYHYIFRRYIQNKTVIINNIVNVYRIVNLIKRHSHKNWDCVFLGRFVYQKNPLKFIKIIYNLKRYNKNITAIMIGDGPLYNNVIKYINKLNLTNNILLVGFQKNPFKYLNRSKIMLMPSRYEGFGLVALESLMSGIPVICTFTGGLRNIINNHCGHFANSIKEYTLIVHKMLIDHNIYNRMSINCIKRFNEVNNLNKFIVQYSKLYNKN